MTIRTTAPVLLAALLLLAQVPAAVAADDDPDEDEPEQKVDAPWSLSLATQVDQLNTRGFTGELGRDVTPNTTVTFRADSNDYTAVAAANFKAEGVELGATHDWESFSISGALGHWLDTDIVTANELKLGGEYRVDPWTVGLKTGYRRADFNTFTSKADVKLPDGTVVPATTRSDCTLDNTAFGFNGRFDGDIWGASVELMDYRYADAKCKYKVSSKSTLSRADRLALRDLSGGQLDRLNAVVSRHIGRDEALLDWSLDAGGSWKHDDLVVSLDYSRQKAYLIDIVSSTYSVTGTADLGDHMGVDCTLGVTTGGGVTSGGFVGFALRARF